MKNRNIAVIGKAHLMRLFALNASIIWATHDSLNHKTQRAREAFFDGRTTRGQDILKDIAADKKSLRGLVETQKALKVALRDGNASTKKHGTMDAQGDMHPKYRTFIENCKP